jgi:F-type H+-transporting ATPase subunit b
MISIDYTLIVVILNFILLLVLLNAFLYKPLKKFLTERQQGIADDIKETKEAKMAAQEYIVKQEEEYKAAQQQIHKLMEQARKEAEKRSDEIIKQARAHEKDILVDTEKRLEHEKQ